MTLGDNPPPKCFRTDEFGNLPTCTSTGDGQWEVSYDEAGVGGDGGPGSAFAALFVVALILGVVGTIWKVTTARRMARDAGMDEGDATAMTLFTDEGFESTYLASNLRGQTAPPATPDKGAAGDRLAELQSLRDRGLISEEEHAAARQRILDEL